MEDLDKQSQILNYQKNFKSAEYLFEGS